jgi:hypothetical protein
VWLAYLFIDIERPDIVLLGGRIKTYVGKSLAAVKAHSLEAAVTQHLHDLGILLAVLLEGQLSALVIVLLGSSSAVLAALFLRKERENVSCECLR